MNNLGGLAERKAANYMRKKGYDLIEHNYNTRFGEIDLIFEYNEMIIFTEVKARNENSIALPREFVDLKKQERIIAAASLFISQHKITQQVRFDVIEVYLENYQIKCIKHLENAFTL